jgi:excinuclease UvrABC helicase subunit UvrB
MSRLKKIFMISSAVVVAVILSLIITLSNIRSNVRIDYSSALYVHIFNHSTVAIDSKKYQDEDGGYDDIISKINEELDTKEESLSKVESTEEMVLIESHSEYDLGLRTSVGLTLGEGDFDESIVNFRSGETATSFDAPSSLYFTGDDCLDGRLYPNKNRIYEINIKSVMGIYVARVGACDYEVIE